MFIIGVNLFIYMKRRDKLIIYLIKVFSQLIQLNIYASEIPFNIKY